MDFFGRQEAARKRSGWLLGAFAVATGAVALAVGFVLAVAFSVVAAPEGQLATGFDPRVFAVAAMVTAAFIGLSSLWRLRNLRGGGGAVAQSLGGERVTGLERDPLKRRLHNVVEEMAIAAGLPVPEVYVLENEPGINAFAAGMEPTNAAVAVTRGALDRLSRDELQGVVAHEFSHILNGDMRLNARLMGYLFGLVAVSMVGRAMLRGGTYGSARVRVGNRRGGGAGALVAVGLAILVLGSIGVFAGRVLQAAVSRQREHLADAAAVQFTRNPAGLANALKRIAASPLSSAVRAVRREEIGHMLFATGRRSLAGLLATHPPVAGRIQALDPGWKPGDPAPPLPAPPEPARETGTGGGAGAAGTADAGGILPGFPGLPGMEIGMAAALVGAVDLSMARRVLAMVPEELHRAVLEPEGAAAACLALLLDPKERQRDSQLALLEARLGGVAADRIAQLAGHVAGLSNTLRLALLDLASPALHHLSEARQSDLVHLVQRLVELDGVIEPREAALAAAIETRLRPDQGTAPDIEGALAMLVLLARAGHESDATAAEAWRQGAARLREAGFALPDPLPDFAVVNQTAGAYSASRAARLAAMKAPDRKALLEAMAAVAGHDGHLRQSELELLRTAASALGMPMPPLQPQSTGSMR
ncbi:M48 family metallopeptidase [Thioalkalivibrio sp. XN279]|uniref:M48 family metallopeptidase n=1 Tax=Thioalkalivibrio sp. XN279 TaxID=2714953 RepID=UPI001408354D|nr:M48 family metallopeptidase [Thioalkalivibrio sp. XN279]NHA14931.1 M48 family metalloprotease [Thioalkalivibrio sp. XN279]